MFLLTTLTTALAADPAPIIAPAISHVEAVRITANMPDAETIAFVINCWPEDTNPSLKYTNAVIGFNADTEKLARALTARSDAGTLYVFRNPSPEELLHTLAQIGDELGGLQYKESLVFLMGVGTKGDEDTENALCRNSTGVALADVMGSIKPVAKSSVALIDMSQDLSEASGLGQTLGLTANDWFDNMPNSLAISAGPQGKNNGPGFMPAVIEALEQSAGKPISAGQLIVSLRTKAPALEISTSLGTPGVSSSWTTDSAVLIGGPLIAPEVVATVTSVPTATLSKPKHKISSGWYLAGGGALALIGGGVTTAGALDSYGTLTDYNLEGGESQNELDAAVSSYRTNVILAGGLGGIGALALAGGLTWAALDHGHHTMTITPTANGAVVSGQF